MKIEKKVQAIIAQLASNIGQDILKNIPAIEAGKFQFRQLTENGCPPDIANFLIESALTIYTN